MSIVDYTDQRAGAIITGMAAGRKRCASGDPAGHRRSPSPQFSRRGPIAPGATDRNW